MLVPQVLLLMTKFGLPTMLAKFSGTFFLLVTVTVFAAVALPTAVLAKLRLVADRVTGAMPVPDRAIVCGLLLAL